MNYINLGNYISRKRREKGISRYDLAMRMGYRNLSKGVNRVKDLEEGARRRVRLAISACGALGINMAEAQQAMADDVIAIRKAWLEEWLGTRNSIQVMREANLCGACPFIDGSFCVNPLLREGPRRLKIVKYAGILRPCWCPLGFPGNDFRSVRE